MLSHDLSTCQLGLALEAMILPPACGKPFVSPCSVAFNGVTEEKFTGDTMVFIILLVNHINHDFPTNMALWWQLPHFQTLPNYQCL